MSLEELDKSYVLHTYARNYVNFKYGVNATLYDEMGKDYIDFASGIAVVSVGHGNKRLANAICEQANSIMHISNLYLIEPQAKLAKKIVDLCGIDGRVFFSNSGAEANEGAIKIARKYGELEHSKKYKIITLDNSFHGRTITTLKATAQNKFHDYFGPYPEGFVYADDISDVYNLVDEEVVAVMLELVQGEGGIEPFNKQEVQELAQFLKEKDILLIVDEVQTGVFRSGEFLASTLYEIEPDIITLAKGLAGGVPIGAIITKHKDIFKAGDHGSTFGGNYLSTRASLEVLDILSELKDSGELAKTYIHFEEELKKVTLEFPNLFLKEVGIGLMRGIRAKSAEIQTQIIKEAFSSGLLILKSGRNTVRFLPALTISKDEIDEGFRRLRDALNKI